MKPTLNEEIGMIQQGIDYVNSLEPAKGDVISAAIEHIKSNSEYKPNYVKYSDGKKWVEIKADEEPVFTESFETAMKAIHNDIPSLIEQERIRKQARNAWICIAVIIIVTLIVNWK